MKKTKDDSPKKEEMYTLTEIRKLGFSEKVITALAKRKIIVTPAVSYFNVYKVECFMYLKKDIDRIMSRKTWSKILNENFNFKISEARKRVIDTKRSKLLSDIESLKINIKKISLTKLEKFAVQAKKDFDFSIEIFENDYTNIDKNTLDRWMVNYIRHNLTKYDTLVDNLYNKIGKQEGYVILKTKVLDEIGKIYPELEMECKEQKIRINQKSIMM